MTTSDLVYKKSGRKYIPFGVCQTPNYITPGLWYCDIKPGITSTTNADQYIGHLLKVGDVDTPILNQCKQYKVVQEILNNFDYNKVRSTQELISEIVGEVFKICNNAV